MTTRLTHVRHGSVDLTVHDSGPLDGTPVLLLHGWPQDSRSWDEVLPPLHAAGLRTIVPDLRGTTPASAPRWRWQYRATQLVADVVAIVEQVGSPVHVVGHDWGAALAWYVAIDRPDLVRSLTAFSVPHPGAFLRSWLRSTQLLHSWYMLAFQLPFLPELVIRSDRFRGMLRGTGQAREEARRDAARMSDRRVAHGGLGWYRAAWMTPNRLTSGRVAASVVQVWSDGDVAVMRAGCELAARFVDGPWELVVLEGVSHWIPDETPAVAADLIVAHTSRT